MCEWGGEEARGEEYTCTCTLCTTQAIVVISILVHLSNLFTLYSHSLLSKTCRDFIKFMQKDRDGLNSNVLRFVAKLDTTRPIDMDRRFIVFYHLSDDTIAVFEPPQRNSGK